MIKMGDKVEALDFRETAPGKAGPDFYKGLAKDASIQGGKSIGVPGFPAGLWAIHKRYGKLPWKRLFVFPIKLAREGMNVSGEWVDRTSSESAHFNPRGLHYFFKRNGSAYAPGDRLKQVALAQALLEFRNKNMRGFYDGSVAHDIVYSVHQAGGVITQDDLKNYKARWLEPLKADLNGYTLFLMPPPSSGGVVIKSATALVTKTQIAKQEPFSVEEAHLMIEILKRAFRGRSLLGDPDFTHNPLDFLLTDKYLTKMADGIMVTHRAGSSADSPLRNF